MEAATALAPALGVDAAALVGRALHEGRVGDAVRRLQVAWRRGRAWRAYRRRCFSLWMSHFYGRTPEESEREAQRLRWLFGMEIVAADTDGVLLRRIAPV